MVAKAGLGLIGLSAISVGGVALAKPGWLGMSDPMPEWHPLTEDVNFSDNAKGYTDGKFGKKYGKYLVGVSKPENKDWWEWAFRRLKANNPTAGKFKYNSGKSANVNVAYDNKESEANTKALNQVCKAAYGTDDSTGFGTEDNKFSKEEVWKYCSPGKLTTTSEDTGNDAYGGNTIGGGTDKTSLVSVKNSANDWFWEIRNKDFWSQEESNNWSGKKATGSSLFKTTYDANKDQAENSRKTIKELCAQAYVKTNGDSTDAKKFCVLEAATA